MFQIISNNADHFPDHISSASTPEPKNPIPITLPPTNSTYLSPNELRVLNLNDNDNDNDKASELMNATKKLTEEIETIVVTPKKNKKFNKENRDGIVLTRNEDNEFLEPTNLSPIASTTVTDGLQNIQEEEEGDQFENIDDTIDRDALMTKRKRDSFDNISMISTDSLAPVFNSAKKPKLIRTGSITRTLRRSMSFVALKNPISNMIRARRNSVDPNASINSVTSIESTFNESIKRPVKDKLRSIKERIMKNSNGNKREFCLTPKTPKASKRLSHLATTTDKYMSPDCRNNDNVDASFVVDPFKTPLAPPRSSMMTSASHILQNHTTECESISSFSCHPLNNSTMVECSSVTNTITETVTTSRTRSTTVTTLSPIERATNQPCEDAAITTIMTTLHEQAMANHNMAPPGDQLAVLILHFVILFFF